MRKLIGTICVMALVAGMSLTAFAKPSPEGGRIEAYDADGVKLDILKIEENEMTGSTECDHGDDCDGCIEIITPVLAKHRAIVDALKIESLTKGTKYEGDDLVKIFEMEVIAKGCVKFPITVTFDKDDWVEGKPVIAHYDLDTQKWELVEVNEASGKFTTVFNSLSPFVFYVEKGSAGTTSPSTGEPISMAVAAVALGATGLAVVSKKKRV